MESLSDSRSRPILRLTILAALAVAVVYGSAKLWQAVQAAQLHAAIDRLRTMYFTEDFEGAKTEGPRMVLQFRDSTELQAWYLLAANSHSGLGQEAVKRARQMTQDHPNDPWAWFALSGTQVSHLTSDQEDDEALAASAKALAMMPRHPDFIWLRAWTLFLSMKHAGEVPAFVDAHLTMVPNPAELLVLKARALEFLGTEVRHDEAQIAAAYEIMEEARRADPENFHARWLPGLFLSRRGEPEKGLPLLKNAVAVAPDSTVGHREYWRAFNALEPSLQPAERAAVLADVQAVEAGSGERPWALSQIAEQYGSLGMRDRQVALEDKLLREHRDDPIGRIVISQRITRLADATDLWGIHRPPPDSNPPIEAAPDPEEDLDAVLERELTETLKQSLWDYVGRHDDKDDWLLQSAYYTLFVAVKDDPTVGAEQLLRVVRGMAKHPFGNTGFASGALALADRGAGLAEAEAMTRERLSALEQRLAKEKSDFKSEANYNQYIHEITGRVHDALGWVLFKQHRVSEAEKELIMAYRLDPGDVTNLYHLGKLAETQGDLARSRRFYAEGAALPSQGENPSIWALKQLYKDQHGSLEGFGADLTADQDRGRAVRRERLLAAALAPPVRLPAFRMADLKGSEFSSDRLDGKVGVIDFWGVWCPSCKKAAPYFQKLVEKYRNDPEVVILSVDAYDALPQIKKWSLEKGLTYPILMDDGYVSDHAGLIEAFPTTWFVNRRGEIVYIQRGSDENLVEEFSWRIEHLKDRPSGYR